MNACIIAMTIIRHNVTESGSGPVSPNALETDDPENELLQTDDGEQLEMDD